MASHPVIHDNFDANWSWWVILEHEHLWHAASDVKVTGLMHGAPRLSLGAEYFLPALMVRWFGLLYGWLVTETIIRLVAFAGCWALLRQVPKFFKAEIPIWFWPWLCCAFSWLPFYPTLGTAIAGMPALIAVMLTLWQKPEWRMGWLLASVSIVFYAVGSSLVTTGVFILMVLAVVPFAVNAQQALTLRSLPYWLAVFLLLISYAGVDYRLIEHMLHPQWESQRSEALLKLGGFSYVLTKRILPNLLVGQYHAASGQSGFLWWVLFGLIGFHTTVSVFGYQVRHKLIPLYNALYFLMASIVILSIVYGIRYWSCVDAITQLWPTLHQFNWGRFHFFHPLLWWFVTVVVFSLVCNLVGEFVTALSQRVKYRLNPSFLSAVVGIFFLAGVLWAQVTRHSEYLAWKQQGKNHNPSLNTFLAPTLFKQARQLVQQVPDAAVVHIGLHPAASQIAHIPTVDHYLALYPLQYKHNWESLMQSEWPVNSAVYNYFQTSANRCYAFHPQLGLSLTPYLLSPPPLSITAPLFNVNALRAIGATHVFSIAPFKAIALDKRSYSENIAFEVHYQWLKTFSHPSVPWRLYVYRIVY